MHVDAKPVRLGFEARSDPQRLPGWTTHVVVMNGLGTVVERTASHLTLRLDGRASGPVFVTLAGDEIARWENSRRLARELGL